ncbi:thioredoxin family protein [Alloiococcus sp. CFN-8]|uniref:thioredoxin family protein n=1 Tax=Alloiococcus sp. CFN-8 TaxID=3416081 RepID=UPI003CF1DFF1
MALFKIGKKKEVKSCCGGNFDAENMQKAKEAVLSGSKVKVLGTGCAKCNALEANVKQALEGLGMDTTIDHVTDFTEIAAYGVMTTPALVVDGKVVSFGKVLSPEEAAKLLK